MQEGIFSTHTVVLVFGVVVMLTHRTTLDDRAFPAAAARSSLSAKSCSATEDV